MLRSRGWVLVLGLLVGCGGLGPDEEFTDGIDGGGRDDAGAPDAGVSDAGVPDAGVPDAGVPDAGVPDAGMPDAGMPDAGVPDAGMPDAGVPDAGVRDAGVPDAGVPDAGPPRRPVTICLTGACSDLSANCGSNFGFTDLCDQLGLGDAGLVRSSSGSTFATAFDTNAQTVVTPLFTALDRNLDGLVNALDGPIDLTIVGFSWGGVNGGDLAERVSNDSRIDHASLFQRVIILDAFQPTFTSNPKVSMPAQVDEAWSFRHSVAPFSDCSNGAPLGPYLGRRLACAAGRPCRDFDFSLAPAQTFNGLVGTSVGHCDVPSAARPYVLELVGAGSTSTTLPPSVPVSP